MTLKVYRAPGHDWNCPRGCHHADHWSELSERAQELFLQANPCERAHIVETGHPSLIWCGVEYWEMLAENARPDETFQQWIERWKPKRFEVGEKHFEADTETADLLLSLIPSAVEAKDWSAVIGMIILGKLTGRIREVC